MLGASLSNTNIGDNTSMALYGNNVYIASRNQTNMVIYDISGATPVYVKRIQSSPTNEMSNIWGLTVSDDGRYVYTVSWSSGAGAWVDPA